MKTWEELRNIRNKIGNDMLDLIVVDAVLISSGDLTQGQFENLCYVLKELYMKDEEDISIYRLIDWLNAYMCEEDKSTNDLMDMPTRELLGKLYFYYR